MILKSIITSKQVLTTVDETATLQVALEVLEESGFRCVPILDASGQIFRGNIYKMHIYRHKANGGDMNLPVTHLLKNATKFIYLDTSFFKVFFTIKELPYIAVLDDENHFFGILTHSKLLSMLSDAWNVDTGSYVLTIASPGNRGDLAQIAKIIAKYSEIANCITLDVDQKGLNRRTLITLPPTVGEDTLETIRKHLEKKHFQIIEVEDLRNPE
ncbi:cyclic di-AMP binding protein CbpA [Enterococcus timonensis]|uniref:cyclic di-AMP binding protein CbpA n=1 Tax=Enterococcus timonensis TaxID=1852364 RepID=UPI0008DADD6D|nr:cyclic di-AMP binding protein CbpA [Enterococcus timonensis]